MSFRTQARPYAIAAFEYAKSRNTVDQWWQFLHALRVSLSDPKVRHYIADPTVDDADKITLLERLCNDWLIDDVKHFIKVLADSDRLMLANDIFEMFEIEKEKAERILRVQFTTAFELDERERNSLVAAVEQRSGENLNADFLIDASIIGGVIIRMDNDVIDMSVQQQLRQLKQILI